MGLRSKCHNQQWAWAEIYKPVEPFVESIPGYLQQITEVLRYAPSCITFIVGVELLFFWFALQPQAACNKHGQAVSHFACWDKNSYSRLELSWAQREHLMIIKAKSIQQAIFHQPHPLGHKNYCAWLRYYKIKLAYSLNHRFMGTFTTFTMCLAVYVLFTPQPTPCLSFPHFLLSSIHSCQSWYRLWSVSTSWSGQMCLNQLSQASTAMTAAWASPISTPTMRSSHYWCCLAWPSLDLPLQ